MAIRRARIAGAQAPDGAIVLHRVVVKYDQVVYIGVANRRMQYDEGRSRILYIGVTRRGVRRIASSAAAKAQAMFKLHGVKTLQSTSIPFAAGDASTWHESSNAPCS